MLKYSTVDIRISELHTQRVTVPNWEVPVLTAVHGDTVTPVEETLFNRKVPDTADEFQRLANRYRSTKNEDGSVGIPYVASVYGQFGVGTAALSRAIAEATVADEGTKDFASDGVNDLLGDTRSSVGG